MTKSLDNIRVLDFTQVLAGPFCTQMLADHGAEVIKIEPPGGESARWVGLGNKQSSKATSPYFSSTNRNKKSICIDLKHPHAKDLVLRLAATVDVVVENFRAGTMERLGLSYESMREVNPKLVYASIRGFGDQRGGESPYVNWPAFDIVAQAYGGLASITGPDAMTPMKAGPGLGDIIPAIFSAFGIVLALRVAANTGVGQYVDVAMVDSVLAVCERIVHQYRATSQLPVPEGNAHPFFCPYGLFKAADGWVTIGCLTDAFWIELTRIMQRDDLTVREDLQTALQRQLKRNYVNALVNEWVGKYSRNELEIKLGGRVPYGPVNNAADISENPHFAARNMLVTLHRPDGGEELLVNTPVKLTLTAGGIESAAPELGAHTLDILKSLGLAESTIAEFITSGVVSPFP